MEFFWLLSGFVFASVYAGRAVTVRRFAVARFARLYPLALLTLLVVAALDLLCRAKFGQSVSNASNDWPHFVQNLLFVSGWEFDQTKSFNFSIWSVSVEVLIYAVLIAVLPWLFRRGIAGPVLLALLFRIATLVSLHNALQCGFLFFTGCAVFVLHRRTATAVQLAAGGTVLVAALLWLAMADGRGVFMAVAAAFAATVLLAAALEGAAGGVVERVRWFGDASDGIYLWHVPVQLAAVLSLADRAVLLSPWALLAFVVTTIAVARLSYLWVEAPARRWINPQAEPARVMAGSSRTH